MYLSYYNLKVKPFQMSTDPEFLWLGEKHKEALAVLKYAILENKGVLALTGDVGTGKTTLINALLKSLGKDTITATVYDARLEVLDFFRTVAAAFRIKGSFEGKGEFILKFMDFLIKAHERNQKVLLIIDEAQGIHKDLLEEIRLLSNLEAKYARLLNIFFVGQNEFIDILQKYENRALRQRVTIRYHIDPLTLNETANYIRHRLEVSGTTAPIFDSGAIDEIYFFSGGYPRLINIMCDHALLTGYVREVRTINANHIRECREELLVSKKSSAKVFEFPAGNQQEISREPMASDPFGEPSASGSIGEPSAFGSIGEPSAFGSIGELSASGSIGEPSASGSIGEPSASGPIGEPSASGPSREPMASDLSRELMDYVNDSQLTNDQQYRFAPRFSMYDPESLRKPKKKRFFSFFSILIFLFVAGAGYFVYGRYHNQTLSLATMPHQPSKNTISMNAGSKNNNPTTTKAPPDVSNVPKQVQSEGPEDSRLSLTDSSSPGESKVGVSQKTESSQPVPSKTFSKDAGGKPFSKIPDDIVSVDRIPAKKPDNSGSLNVIPKIPIDAELPKETAGMAGSGTARSELNPKTEAATLPSIKPLEKIQVSNQTREEIPPKPFTVAKASKNPPAKKPEPAKSITQPVRGQNKTKAPEAKIRELPKKEMPVTSSAPSEKRTKALFEKFKKKLSKKRVVSKDVNSVKPPTTIKKTAPSAYSMSHQKNTSNLKADNRTDRGTDEKIASLGVGANAPEKAGKKEANYIPLTTRIESFLKKYCRTYEQKDLDRFSTLFAVNAVEKGKPFKSWFPKYRQNFRRIDSIEYNIDLNRYATQEDTGLVKIDGTFHIRAKLEGRKDWLKNSGDISMVLESDGNSFKVKELNY